MTRVERSLVWLAGASEDVLSVCARHEQMKYAALGATLLVPVVGGFIAGFYTAYSLTTSVALALLLAVAWAGSLLILDRAVLITYTRGPGQWAKIVLRLLIAAIAGFIIAHAIVLFVFRDQIAMKTAEYRQSVIASLEATAKRQMEASRAEEEQRHRLALDSKAAHLDDLRRQRASIMFATRGKQMERMLLAKDIEIDRAQAELDALHAQLGYEQARRIEATLAADIARESRREYNDILSRTTALHDVIVERLDRGDYSALATYLLLAALLFALDTLPILTKMMLPRDTYETVLQRTLQHAADRALLDVEERWQVVQSLGRDRQLLRVAAERLALRRALPEPVAASPDDDAATLPAGT